MSISRLNDEQLSHIFTFVAPERPSEVSRNLRVGAASAMISWALPQILESDENSLLGRVRDSFELSDTDEGKIEFVKAVRRSAIEALEGSRRGLTQHDYVEMDESPAASFKDYSYPKLNDAWARLESNVRDEALIAAFDQIFELHPPIELAVDSALPEHQLFEPHPSRSLAAHLRDWLRNPENAELIEIVDQLDFSNLASVPKELLLFPNLPLDQILLAAYNLRQIDALRAALEDPRETQEGLIPQLFQHAIHPFNPSVILTFINSRRELSPELVGEALVFGAEDAYKQLVRIILESGRPIDPAQLGATLVIYAQWGDKEMMQRILNGNRPIDPNQLGWALEELSLWVDSETIQQILDSDRPINAYSLGAALRNAVRIGNQEIVHGILASNRPIHDGQFARALKKAVETQNEALVQVLLDAEPAISDEELGKILRKAVILKHRGIVERILSTDRPIDSEQVCRSLKMAAELGEIEIFDLLLGSAHEMEPIRLGAVLADQAAHLNRPLVAKILASPRPIDSSQLARAYRSADSANDSELAAFIKNSGRPFGRRG